MALSKRTTTLIASLASRGDAFARHLLSKATKRDSILLGNLSNRGDLEAQKHLKGTRASVPAKAFVNRMAAAGDSIAQGLNDFRGADKLVQTITFAQPANKTFGDAPYDLAAPTGGAGSKPVVLTVYSGPATISGRRVTLTGAGTVVFAANQAGDDNYLTAVEVRRSITVAKAAATVTLGALSATYDGSPKEATATTDPAGKVVTLTYDGSATAPTNAGTYAVVGTINDANYQGSATDSLVIDKAEQAITFDPPATASVAVDSPLTLTAVGGASGAPVTFSVVSGPATLVDNVLTLTGAGDVVVAADQAEGVNYLAAPQVTKTITVSA